MTWRLLTAGVRIYEYRPGLLHAKTLCLDGVVSQIASTNLNLRSFDLNFEKMCCCKMKPRHRPSPNASKTTCPTPMP